MVNHFLRKKEPQTEIEQIQNFSQQYTKDHQISQDEPPTDEIISDLQDNHHQIQIIERISGLFDSEYQQFCNTQDL